jgi:hypothetical protein
LSKSTENNVKQSITAQAKKLLAELEQMYLEEDRPDLKPTSMTYNIALDPIAESKQIDGP